MPSQGSIGSRVRGLRLSRRLSQTQLAGDDLSDSYVSLIESGKRTPTPVVVRLLAERLGCTPEYLLQGIEPRQQLDAELGLRYAVLELHHGDPEEAATRLRGLAKEKADDNPQLATAARISLARAKEAQGRFEDAIEDYETLRTEAVQHPELIAELTIIAALGRCYGRAGDIIRAGELVAEAGERAEELGLDRGEDAVEVAEAMTWIDGSSGGPFTEKVLSAARIDADPPPLEDVKVPWETSRSVAEAGHPVIALRLADDALRASTQIWAADALARIRLARAAHLLHEEAEPGDIERAERLLDDADRHLTGSYELGTRHMLLARARVLRRQPDAALTQVDQALAHFDKTEGVRHAEAYRVKALAYLVAGPISRDEKAASAALAAAAEHLASLPTSRNVAKAWRAVGDLYEELGDHKAMAAAYRSALRAIGLRSPIAVLYRESITPR